MPRTRNQVNVEEKKRLRVDWNDLPPELMSRILSYLSFDEIADCRLVCKSFNDNGKYLLNKEAKRILDVVRANLVETSVEVPQNIDEEWQETDHVLRREWQFILNSISKLHVMYEPYVDDGSSCFVAGMVLDYVNEVLASTYFGCCAYAELFHLTTQAWSHFRGVVVPLLRKRRLRPRPARAALNVIGKGNEEDGIRRKIQGLATIKKRKMCLCLGQCIFIAF